VEAEGGVDLAGEEGLDVHVLLGGEEGGREGGREEGKREGDLTG